MLGNLATPTSRPQIPAIDSIESTSSQDKVLTVSALNLRIKSIVNTNFRQQIAVVGELSGLHHHQNTGHLYFALKDKDTPSIIECAFFKNRRQSCRLELKNSDEVIVRGMLDVYAPRGSYSIIVHSLSYYGEPLLRSKQEELKRQLEARGYFCKKRPLPRFPKKIVLITSKDGAVLHDMVSVAKSRFHALEFLFINTPVQGPEAKFHIADSLRRADSLGADILVLARGGGSMEDLWSFNEMEVLEAIFACKTLVVSAIGHDSDTPLSDFVADARAPTPSAAMEMILMDSRGLLDQLWVLNGHLDRAAKGLIESKTSQLNYLGHQLEILHPRRGLERSKAVLASEERRLGEALSFLLSRSRQDLRHGEAALESLAPSQRIQNYKRFLYFQSKRLVEVLEGLVSGHHKGLEGLSQRLDLACVHLLERKKLAGLPQLEKQCIELTKHLILKKREMLNHLSALIESLDPRKSVKEGFAQVLKDGSPTRLEALKCGDMIELVDPSGSVKARVI